MRPVFRSVLIAAALLASSVLSVHYLLPAVLRVGGSTSPSFPRSQGLTTAGESWSSSDASPVILNVTTGHSGNVWMNFTVSGGAFSVLWCPANVVIKPMVWPPYSPRVGVVRATGEALAWSQGST